METTLKNFAALVGISTRHASELRKSGIIPESATEIGELVRPYIARLREQAAGRASNGDYDLTTERARLAYHHANIAALDEREKHGELVPADAVRQRWQEMAANTRAHFLTLPTKLAGVCVGKGEPEIEASIREAVYQALTELARGDGT